MSKRLELTFKMTDEQKKRINRLFKRAGMCAFCETQMAKLDILEDCVYIDDDGEVARSALAQAKGGKEA